MLGWKVVKGQQLLAILRKAVCGLWMFQLLGGDELIKSSIGVLPGLGHPNLM